MRNAARVTMIVVILALLPSVAAAQTSDVALARQLFEEGVSMLDDGHFAEAADRFQRSYELRASPIVAYNLGSALRELGRLVEASEAFRQTIQSNAPEEVSRAARNSLSELVPRLGNLTVTLSGDDDGVEVFVDARALPPQAIGVRTPIDPGSRQVRAMRDGDEIASSEVEVEEGGAAEVTLDLPARPADDEGLGAEPDPLLQPDAEEEEGGSVLGSPWLWITVGALVAGAVVLILVLTLGGQDNDPVAGNLTPGIVEF